MAPEKERETKSQREAEMRSDERYESTEDLPRELRSILPVEAQDVYLDAYQRSWDSYDEHEGGELDQGAVAHRDGWHAVRQEFVKHDASGRWYPIGELPEEEEEDEDEGLIDQIKDIF